MTDENDLERGNLLFLHALNAPKFPHDPTLNQFLDQHQIHAYQLLGKRSAKEALAKLSKPAVLLAPTAPLPAPGVAAPVPPPVATDVVPTDQFQ